MVDARRYEPLKELAAILMGRADEPCDGAKRL